jgi:hypothetical protein
MLPLKNRIEEMRKVHREFECNGAYDGKGCYEDWCDIKTCTSKDAVACKTYNQALDDVLAILPSHLEALKKEVGEEIDNEVGKIPFEKLNSYEQGRRTGLYLGKVIAQSIINNLFEKE